MSYEVVGFEAINYETVRRTVEGYAASLSTDRGPFGDVVHLGFDLYAAESDARRREATSCEPHLYLVKP